MLGNLLVIISFAAYLIMINGVNAIILILCLCGFFFQYISFWKLKEEEKLSKQVYKISNNISQGELEYRITEVPPNLLQSKIALQLNSTDAHTSKS